MAKKKEKINLADAQKVDLKATRVFMENLESEKEINVNIGGGASSKSYSICQLITYKFLTEKSKKILVVRKTLPSLRTSVLWLFYKILDEFGVRALVKEDKVGMNLFFRNNVIHFNGLDDPEKVKCFHPDTDVFTKEGFKNIKEVKVGDLVATLNPKTGKAEFRPIVNYYVYDFNGELIEPSSVANNRDSYVGFSVTPEHKMLTHTRRRTNWEFVEAKDLPNTFFIKQSAEFDSGNIVDSFTIPIQDYTEDLNSGKKEYKNPSKWKNNKNGRKETTFSIISWLKFFGWFISEGTIDKTTIIISQTKKEGREKFLSDMKDFSYQFTERERDFVCFGKDLANYLKQFGKSYDKFIPRDILDLHPSLLKYLFEALIAGDGYKCSDNSWTYCTNSRQLVDDVSEIAIKLGYVPSFYEIDTKKYYGDVAKTAWCVRIVKRDEVRIENKKYVPYNGKVYCIEVLPYHTTLTRYKNKIAWTGQSSDWNYMWFEEATDITRLDFDTVRLYLRAKSVDGNRNQVFLTFNPIDEFHWIKEYLIDNAEMAKHVKVVHSTYKDNPFIDERTKERYEELMEQDINFYRIYALGEWGKLENLIYKNWDIVDTIPTDGKYRVLYGLDPGYNDPTAFVRCCLKDNDLYIEEVLYQPKLTNSDTIAFLKSQVPKAEWNRPIYCDSQYPDRIKEIRLEGFNIKAAQKNIGEGIDVLKRLKIHVLKTSTNLIKEFRAYSWKTDKRGMIMDEPVDFMNHGMDALRYAVYSQLRGEGVYKVRWL